MVKVPQHIKNLQGYIAGKPIEELARERNLSRIVKLASNENPLGASPKAMKAAAEALEHGHRYVDPNAFELTSALAEKISRAPEQIVWGAGVDSLLAYIISAFSNAGDEVLTSQGTFIGIYVNSNKLNRKLALVPLREYHIDLDGIISGINERTRIIYLANPNNPTGTFFTGDQFESFMAQVPTDKLVILDEAYNSFASGNPVFPNGLEFEYDNLILTRTFSKDYGLAGLRVGYAVGNETLMAQVRKVKLPFEPGCPAQQAALAAMEDDDFINRSTDMNRRSITKLLTEFDRIGLKYVPPGANFILMIFKSEASAKAFNEACLDQGLILRHVGPFGIPNGVRINSGNEDETDFAIDVIRRVVTSTVDQTEYKALAGKAGN